MDFLFPVSFFRQFVEYIENVSLDFTLGWTVKDDEDDYQIIEK